MKIFSKSKSSARRENTLDKVWGTLAERPAGRLLASLRKTDDRFGRALNGLADFTTPQQLIIAAQKGSQILREAIAHHDHDEDGSAEEILEALSVDAGSSRTDPDLDERDRTIARTATALVRQQDLDVTDDDEAASSVHASSVHASSVHAEGEIEDSNESD